MCRVRGQVKLRHIVRYSDCVYVSTSESESSPYSTSGPIFATPGFNGGLLVMVVVLVTERDCDDGGTVCCEIEEDKGGGPLVDVVGCRGVEGGSLEDFTGPSVSLPETIHNVH